MVIEVCVPVAPRFIRLRDASRFFGMDKNRFNREVRPHLTEIRIGTQGRAFDRLEVEAAAEEYKSRNGIPVAKPSRRKSSWEIKERQDSLSAVGSGTSPSSSEECAFARALEQAMSGKPKSIDGAQLEKLAHPLRKSDYGAYLIGLLREGL